MQAQSNAIQTTPPYSELNYWCVIQSKVLTDKTLSPNAKLLYALISGLCKSVGFCYATNQYLGEQLDISITATSLNIKRLINAGLVFSIVYTNTDNQKRRRLYIDKELYEEALKQHKAFKLNDSTQSLSKVKGGALSKVKDKDIYINTNTTNVVLEPEAHDDNIDLDLFDGPLPWDKTPTDSKEKENNTSESVPEVFGNEKVNTVRTKIEAALGQIPGGTTESKLRQMLNTIAKVMNKNKSRTWQDDNWEVNLNNFLKWYKAEYKPQFYHKKIFTFYTNGVKYWILNQGKPPKTVKAGANAHFSNENLKDYQNLI